MSGSTRDRLRRAARRFLLGSGPLKRNSDRLQVAGRFLFVLSLLAAVPLAVVVAGTARTRLAASAAAEAAERQQTRAVVLEDSATIVPEAGDHPSSLNVIRAVRWDGLNGVVRHGTLLVPDSAVAGSTVPVWIDRNGDLAAAPPGRGVINDQAALLGLAIGAGVPLTVWGLHCGLCLGLSAHRARRWGQDWKRVEREWRARQS